jgi:hypothetical protein
MRARKSNALNSIDRRDTLKKMDKRYTGREVQTVGIYRLTEKNDLSPPSVHRDSYLSLDLRERARDLWPTGRRDDAVRTALIAAATDRDKRGNVIRFPVLRWIGVREPKGQLLPILSIVNRDLWRGTLLSELNE